MSCAEYNSTDLTMVRCRFLGLDSDIFGVGVCSYSIMGMMSWCYAAFFRCRLWEIIMLLFEIFRVFPSHLHGEE
jgi:hypothetical protein